MEKGRATRSHKKGSIIPIGDCGHRQPLLLLPPPSRPRRRRPRHQPLLPRLVDFCVGCGRPVISARVSGAAAGIVPLPQFPPLPAPSAAALESPSVILCDECSSDSSNRILSCLVDDARSTSTGSTCCINGENSGNQKPSEWKEDDACAIARSQLRRYLHRLVEAYGQGDGTAAALTATCSLIVSAKSREWDEIMAKMHAQIDMDGDIDNDACKAEDGTDDDDVIGECWALLLPCRRSDDDDDNDDNNDTPCAANAFLRKGPAAFGRLVQSVRRCCLFWVNAVHPVATYVERLLPTLSEEEMDAALQELDPLVGWAFRNDGKVLATEKGNAGESSAVLSETIRRYRQLARLAQIMSPHGDGMGDAGDSVPSPRDELDRAYQVIFPGGACLGHSCNPNCAVVCRQESDAGKVSALQASTSPVSVELLALHDIEEGERLTVSRMDGGDGLDLSVDERASALHDVMGSGYTCLCSRCRYERLDISCRRRVSVSDECDSDENGDGMPDDGNKATAGGPSFYWKKIKTLGDLAMQQGRHEDADELYSIVLKSKPSNGECLHARAASYLERGMYCKSQQLWREAHEVCPAHREISLATAKQKAYGYDKGVRVAPGDGIASFIPTNYSTLLEKQCFITGQESPLLSLQECQQAIQWAENAAKDRPGGWTTTRHYAVPTTDLPVHEIPQLLEFFSMILANRLRPLMAHQFGLGEVGVDGRDLQVHDAFIVRYDAEGGQRHLPVHTDDSSHSFTIALNDYESYEGGGTYICSLGRSYRPSVGGILTFRGDQIQHGGDPVVRGTRYVIVGFLYVDKHAIIDDDISRERETKKAKLDEMFHSGDRKAGSTGFSFGFDMEASHYG